MYDIVIYNSGIARKSSVVDDGDLFMQRDGKIKYEGSMRKEEAQRLFKTGTTITQLTDPLGIRQANSESSDEKMDMHTD